MASIYYGNLEDTRSTEKEWLDDEEFDELGVDLKQFEVTVSVPNRTDVQSASKVFISFFEKNAPTATLRPIGQVANRFLNGVIYKVTDDVAWFRLSSLERLPSRTFTSKLIEKLYAELYPRLLTNGQSIYLLTQQPSFDHPFEYFTNQQTDDLKAYQLQLPIMFNRPSEGLLFELCIKNQKKIHILKLPMLLDEVDGLRQFLPAQLYNELKMKNNYLLSSSNLYA